MNKRRTPARRPAASPAEGAIVFSLLGTAHALEARLEAAVDKVGLSLAKAGVLKCLADAKEPVALSDMAQRLACVRSNMTQLVDRLEQDGLVRRRADSADRRSVRAELTPAGERAHAAASQALDQEQRAIVAGLGSGPAAGLASALRLLGGT
jgi:DNA-binding MarR family transcriptional regulator